MGIGRWKDNQDQKEDSDCGSESASGESVDKEKVNGQREK